MTLKLLSAAGAALLLIAGAACAGDFGSFVRLGPYSGNAGGWAGGPGGSSWGRVDLEASFQYARGGAIDSANGLGAYDSYAFRLPDGRVIANSFNLRVAPGDTFFSFSHGDGGYEASAGGRLYGRGTGMTWGHGVPSPMHPAHSQGYGQSFPY
jgi:hypothetical protein